VRLWFILLSTALLTHDRLSLVSQPAAPTAPSRERQALRERLEYHPTENRGGLSAANRAQGLRLAFTEAGLSVEEQGGTKPVVTLGITAFGRPGAERALSKTPARVSVGNRVERNWNGMTEWFLNQPEGVEHGWTVKEKALGEGPLLLSVAVSGAKAVASNNEAVFESDTGRVLRYRELKALDASGSELRARMMATAAGLRIEVDDTGARYPIIVDPLLTTSAWTAESNQPSAYFGDKVASAGDVNGDGYSDILVGARLFDNGEVDEGQAFLYLGTANGPSPTPAWAAEGNQATAWFSNSLSSAGDVNGDGYSDVVVGAYLFDNGEVNEGRASLYLGSAGGLSPSPAWTVESNQANAGMGSGVASAGDVNGDGYSDVVVSAYTFTNGETSEGQASLYLGSASGLSMTPAWTAEGNQANAGFGSSVATAGDVNGDGYSDVVVGAWGFSNGESREGRAFLYLGSASGLNATAAWTAEGNQASAEFGFSVATAGDVNCDGYSDVLVGVRLFDNGETDEGQALLFLGSASGLSPTPAWTAESNQATAWFGVSVSSAGDVNGDGCSDVTVGAYLFDDGESNEGRALLYLGSTAGLSLTPAWTAEGNQASASFGNSVASAGDVNGDGFSDVVAGAFLFDNGEGNEGRAFLYLGSASGLRPQPAWTAEGNQVDAWFGYNVAGAGDVNGDGYSDVIVGAPLFDNPQSREGGAFLYLGSTSGLGTTPAWTAESNQFGAQFGVVSRAGDVNGDGYSDVVVGAASFSNGQPSEGRAFVYLGSASGLGTTAAWAEESNQASALFGGSVASAGDVNGDGYSDVLVTALQFDNGEADEGRVFLYLGGAGGLSTTPGWTAESNQAGSNFAVASSAGDVNGDGYSDVVVGASRFDNDQSDEGRAFLYLGSASGLSSTPDWTAEGNQASANFGNSVASAGDTNRDGYSDVLVGASFFDNGEFNEGRAFLYLGSAGGLGLTPAWTAESNQDSAIFGYSIASGDVNGDGYSDVIVGALNFDNGEAEEGRGFLYLGAAAGLSSTPAWTAESNQSASAMGTDVAGAGDVNGDGYADVVVGAYQYDNGEDNEGRAFLYLGGDTATAGARGLRQQLGSATPSGPVSRGVPPVTLSALGFNGLATQGRVTLETEVKPVGTRFDGSAVVRSPSGLGPQRLAASWPTLAPGRYHWRARLTSGQERGRWLSFGANSESEADFAIVLLPVDAGAVDAGTVDAGAVDAGAVDAGAVDAGDVDAGGVDAGAVDAGEVDAGEVDAGEVDAGEVDAGEVDAGEVDAGEVDAGEVDAGLGKPLSYAVGCDCSAASGPPALLFVLLLWRARRGLRHSVSR
jgi:hypothetical protein